MFTQSWTDGDLFHFMLSPACCGGCPDLMLSLNSPKTPEVGANRRHSCFLCQLCGHSRCCIKCCRLHHRRECNESTEVPEENRDRDSPVTCGLATAGARGLTSQTYSGTRPGQCNSMSVFLARMSPVWKPHINTESQHKMKLFSQNEIACVSDQLSTLETADTRKLYLHNIGELFKVIVVKVAMPIFCCFLS